MQAEVLFGKLGTHATVAGAVLQVGWCRPVQRGGGACWSPALAFPLP